MNGDGIPGKGQKLGRAGLTEGWGRADSYLGTELICVSSDSRVYYEEVPAITKHLTLEFGWHLKIINVLKVVSKAMGKDVIKGEYVWTKRKESEVLGDNTEGSEGRSDLHGNPVVSKVLRLCLLLSPHPALRGAGPRTACTTLVPISRMRVSALSRPSESHRNASHCWTELYLEL